MAMVDEFEKQEPKMGAESKTPQEQADRLSLIAEKEKWNQPGKADSLVGPGVIGMTPGPMQMSAKVQLHSKMAINLFRGRKHNPDTGEFAIIGAARFARQVAMVWSASASDDPYADATLLAIESAYASAKQTLKSKREAVQAVLDGDMDGFEIDMQESVEPVELELRFVSPWGFRASALIKEFDELVRMALTAKHLGLFVDEDWKHVVHESSRVIRHMFEQVNRWIGTGIKRSNMREDDKKAKAAKLAYAKHFKHPIELKDDVLSGKRRARLAPRSMMLVQYLESKEREDKAGEQSQDNAVAVKMDEDE